MKTITPHLWFDKEAKEAAEFYVSVFPNSKITHVSTLSNTPSGDTDIVSFELNGQPFMAISAGPMFTFSEAISFIIPCESQEEIDHYWAKLSGVPEAEQCGWCKDKYGVSWQVTPESLMPELNSKQFAAMMNMKKLDIAALEAAK